MNLNQLEYFISVAETLNFTKAAAKCFISQTAMTQQIRSLEKTVGVPLFIRDKHHVELTAAGRVYLNEARIILHRSNEALRMAKLASEGLQLADGSGTVDVARHKHDAFVLFGLEVVGKLGREGCLTGTLQARYQDDGRCALGVDVHSRAAHQFGQLFVDNLHHQLPGLNALYDISAQSLGFHFVGEFLRYRIAHIGIQQRLAHLFHGFGYVDVGDASLAFKRV